MGGLAAVGAERQADLHQLVAAPLARVVAEERVLGGGIRPARDAVATAGVEAAQAEPVGRGHGPVEDLVVADDGPGAGGVDRHPGGPLPFLEGASQSDEPAPLEHLAMLLVESDLG